MNVSLTLARQFPVSDTDAYFFPNRAVKLAQATGLLNSRNLYWFHDERNFGDAMAPLIYFAITGKRAVHSNNSFTAVHRVHFSVGSILHKIRKPRSAIVWGSGIISRNVTFPEPLNICAVRGPISRQRCLDLGYLCPDVVGDPAILLPMFCKPENKCLHKLGIVPHYVDYYDVMAAVGHNEAIRVIDVTQNVTTVLREISSCEKIISSSLHGIIVAHAYGVPACWAQFSDRLHGDGIKFLDYFSAVLPGMDIEPWFPDLLDVRCLIAQANTTARFTAPDLAALSARLLEACPYV